MNKNDLSNLSKLVSQVFVTGKRGKFTNSETLVLTALGSVIKADYTALSAASGLSENSLRAGSGSLRKLLRKNLIAQENELQSGSYIATFTLTDAGWSVLLAMITGETQEPKKEMTDA